MDDWMVHRKQVEDHSKDLIGPAWVGRKPKNPPFEGLKGKGVWGTGPSGELHRKIVGIIDSSKEVLCVSSFLFADKEIEDALLRVAEDGVRVYLLSAYELRFEQAAAQNSMFMKELLEQSKESLNRLAGKVLVRTSEHLHAKMVASDPKDRQNGNGLLLTANLTTDALTRNTELGIEVPYDLVREMYAQFCRGFWLESKHELLEPGQLRAIQDPVVSNLEPPSNLLVTDSETFTLRKGLLEQIESSDGDILVSCYGFDSKHPVAKALHKATKSGRSVTVLARPRISASTMETLLNLSKAGANVYGHPWLHAKALVTKTDGGYHGTVMTANIEERGLDTGFEMGLRLEGSEARNLRELLLNWAVNFPQTLVVDRRIGDLDGKATLWRDEELVEVEVGNEYTRDLGEIEAPSIDEMETTSPNDFPSPTNPNKLYRQHTYTWTVTPPRLPKKAKVEKEKRPLPVYRLGKDRFVAIQRRNQLGQAKKLAEELGAKIVVSEPSKDTKKTVKT